MVAPVIETRRDQKRGCGWRKAGGLYLVCDGLGRPCGKLPIPLGVCPTCHGGIKPTRSWTWVDGDALAAQTSCPLAGGQSAGFTPGRGLPVVGTHRLGCGTCPLAGAIGRCGLLWVGGKFYDRPEDWNREAGELGVSRRISAVPNGFTVGQTWVLVAHRKAIAEECRTCDGTGHVVQPRPGGQTAEDCPACEGGQVYTPAIFHAFRPTRIEYVVKDDDTEERLAKLAERGITLVRVERVGDTSTAVRPEPAGLF
jgi:hypothetical protein